MRVQDGDVIEGPDRAQVQIEFDVGQQREHLRPGIALHHRGPAREGKQSGRTCTCRRAGSSSRPNRRRRRCKLRGPLGAVDAGNAVGRRARRREFIRGFRGIRERAGERNWSRPAPMRSRAKFAAATSPAAPRNGRSRWGAVRRSPSSPRCRVISWIRCRASRTKYRTTRAELTVDRPISYAEAEPWLNGPYRRVFVKRLQPRLSDPAVPHCGHGQRAGLSRVESRLDPSAAGLSRQAAKANSTEKAPEKKESGLQWPFGEAGADRLGTL